MHVYVVYNSLLTLRCAFSSPHINLSTFHTTAKFFLPHKLKHTNNVCVMVVVHMNKQSDWSEVILNYRMMVKRYPNMKEMVDGLIPGSEAFSLHDEKASHMVDSCAYGTSLYILGLKNHDLR